MAANTSQGDAQKPHEPLGSLGNPPGCLTPPLKALIVGEGARNSDKKPPHSRFLVAGMALKDHYVAGAAAALFAVVLGFAGAAGAQQRPNPAHPTPPPAAPGSSLPFGPSRAAAAPPAA